MRMIFLLLYKQYNHVIEEVGGQSHQSDFANCRRKACPKTREKCWNHKFSRYAAEEGELRIVRPSRGSGGFCHGKIFRNSRSLSANFFNGKSLRGAIAHS